MDFVTILLPKGVFANTCLEVRTAFSKYKNKKYLFTISFNQKNDSWVTGWLENETGARQTIPEEPSSEEEEEVRRTVDLFATRPYETHELVGKS